MVNIKNQQMETKYQFFVIKSMTDNKNCDIFLFLRPSFRFPIKKGQQSNSFFNISMFSLSLVSRLKAKKYKAEKFMQN